MNKYIFRIIGFGICLLIQIHSLSGQSTFIDSLNQASYKTYRQNTSKAKAFAYKALSLAKSEELSLQMVDSYVNLSRCFRLESKWDSAFWTLERAIQLAEESRYDRGIMDATNNLGIYFINHGDLINASNNFKKSLAYAQSLEDYKGQANAYNNLAIISEAQQSYDSSLVYLKGAIRVYEKIPDSIGVARVLMNLAFLFDQKEENDSAIFYNFKALSIQDDLGLIYQQANSYNQIGSLYLEKENQVEALKNYELALERFIEIGDITGQASANTNIGNAYFRNGQISNAELYFEKSIGLARQSEDPSIIGSSLVNLAVLYVDKGTNLQVAEALLKEAIPYLKDSESFSISVAFHSLGRLFNIKDDIGKAESWYYKALESSTYFNDLTSQKLALKDLSEIYEKLNKPRLALQYIKRYQNIKDSLINLESLKTINNLNIQYQTEKKENENLRLQSDLKDSQIAEEKQKALRNQILGISALILLIGLGGFIYYRYRQRIRIKEQEMELEQERARQEQRRKEAEKLRELDAMKTRFFTNISHEFRTPLTLILGQNEQIKETVSDQKVHNRLDMVGRNGHRLLDLVNQVLDVAKLEAGGMTLEMARTDAIPFLKNIFYSFETMAGEKGVKMAFTSELDSLETAFDLKKFERVIFNLLSNAMKFTPEGGSVNMKVEKKENNFEINITDSGVGIKASQLPYIFDRFYQADSSENQPQPGTGIGLSLVKELVELHDGEIKVESELNKGTTFLISLPIPTNLEKFAAKSAENQLSPEALPSKTIATMEEADLTATKKEQVLLIEDNADVRAFVREQILSFGYQVHEAKDGVEGLEMARQIIPDLIISDIMMPRLDGYGVAKGLKEDERTSHIPIVLLTSKASDESKIAGLELGIDDYLLKPFNARELETRIGNLIEQRKRLRERFTSSTTIRPNEVSAVSMDQVFLKKVLDCIEEHIPNVQFGVDVLAREVGMSVSQLNRKLSALVDQTAGKLIRSMRLQRAADLLKQKAGTISEVAYDTGFNSQTVFARAFRQQFGVSPREYVKEQGQ